MPEILERCIIHVKGQGHDESTAYAVCRSALGLKEDGSADSEAAEMSDRDMLIRAASEITKRSFGNFPRLRKWMPVCQAVGEYVNGTQEGTLTVKRFKRLIENYQAHPRQIPVYLLVGQPNPGHPEDLDSRLADGWVEGLKLEDDWLMADVVVNGTAAVAVLQDGVRGASIGTIKGAAYDGKGIGEVLEHVVLTNEPFVKGMNIAAISRQQGGEKIAYVFTTLKPTQKESDMAEKDPKAPGSDKDKPPEKPTEDLNLTDKVTALECLLQEKEGQIRDLTASRDNALEELEKRRENAQNELLLQDKTRLQRQVTAMKIREKVNLGLSRNQWSKDRVKGFDGGDEMSDEITLAWFKNSEFKGNMDRLDYALTALPRKTIGRTFVSGVGSEQAPDGYTAEEREAIKASGKDPDVLARTRNAANFTEWKRANSAEKGA